MYEISGEQEETESESTDSKKSGIKSNMPTAVAGIIVLVFGAAAVKLWMKKAEKGWEILWENDYLLLDYYWLFYAAKHWFMQKMKI